MRRSALLAPAVAFALVAPLAGAAAQEATPENNVEPTTCIVEPRRTASEIAGLFFGPSGERLATPMPADSIAPADLPAGEPVDPAVADAVDDTVRLFIACFGGGQYARGFALLTDDAAREFGPDPANPAEDTAEEVIALLEGQLTGTPTGEELVPVDMRIGGPYEARRLDDGRVAARWSIEGDEALVILEEQDGTWLIDEVIDIDDSATAAATPAA